MNFRDPSLLCIGECMVEMALRADGNYKMGFAGDTFNTAWYARKLLPEDWAVDYYTTLGDDAASAEMIAFVDRAGIGVASIDRIAGKTAGLYMIQLENGERSFSYWRENSAARQLAADPAKLQVSMAKAGIIYFSGITLAILSAADRDNLFAALTKARENGAILAFDPNLRPRLWPDIDSMCTAITQAATLADIVLPSYDDEADYFGDKSPADTANRYSAPLVIVKNGEGEMLIRDGDKTQTFTPKPISDVVDSTAAGDSFNAGFFAVLAAGGTVMDGVKKGAETSAKVIMQRGALVEV